MEDYQSILEKAGYPTDILVIDFETYFDHDYTLSKMGVVEYIADDRFELTGMGWYDSDEFSPGFMKSDIHFCPGHMAGHFISLMSWDEVTVVAKNCNFDIRILRDKFDITPPYVIDVEDLSRFYDSRMKYSLKSLAKTFGLTSKGETVQFLGQHYKEMTDKKQKALAAYCRNDVELELELFKILLPYVSNVKLELWLARHTLKLSLQPAIELDFELAAELKSSMDKELRALLDKVKWIEQDDKDTLTVLRTKILFPQILQNELPEGEIIPMKQGKKEMIPALAKSDEGFQQLLVHPVQRVRELCQAKQAAKSWPAHIKRIEKMELAARCYGGKLPIPLKYCGGHTSRWSGGGGYNLQNLGGRGRAGAGNHPLISKMRGLLKAPDGYILGIVDSAQIECRVLAWLAGEKKLLTGFANNEDIYSEFATKLFGHQVYKDVSDDPVPVQKLMKLERGFGKDTILGAGYGMGTLRFYSNCYANPTLRPMFDSGQFDFDFVQKLITLYRTTYSRIPLLWKRVEAAFKWAIRHPGARACIDNFLRFYKDDHVYIELPSGRKLMYRHCSAPLKGEIKWRYGKLWGGSLVENLCQAIARDLLAEWIYAIEQEEIQVVLHVHDEIIALLPEDSAEKMLQIMHNIMCTNPLWAKGLPLDAESGLSKRYKK